MKRITRILAIVVLFCSGGSYVCAKTPPNVLLIVCDDLNNHVSTSRYQPITTPALEKLAAESMTFGRAYCQYPVCGPSRASFLSGLYPESSGILNNTLDIRNVRPGTKSMPQVFKDNGYWTAGVGKVFHNTKADPGGRSLARSDQVQQRRKPCRKEAA